MFLKATPFFSFHYVSSFKNSDDSATRVVRVSRSIGLVLPGEAAGKRAQAL